MVSLCGLALSSLFVVNSKSVVHADAVNDANNQNNNAISWDSDSDKAQQVQNDSEQPPVQKADSNQQNLQSVQPSRAETSNVESSSVERRAADQNTIVQTPSVSNVNDAQKTNPIVINNPAGDKVNVHYVNRDGGEINDANVKDITIDASKVGRGSYSVPSGYTVNNPDGKYNVVSNGPISGANLKGSVEHVAEVKNYALGDVPLSQIDKQFADYVNANDVPLLDDTGWFLNVSNYAGTERGINTIEKAINYSTGRNAFVYALQVSKSQLKNELDGNKLTDLFSGVAYPGTNPYFNGEYTGRSDMHGVTYYIGVGNTVKSEKPRFAKIREAMTAFAKKYPDKAYWGSTSGTSDVLLPLTNLGTPAYDVQHLPVAFVDSNNNLVGMVENYSGKVGTSQNISLSLPTGYKLADGASLPTNVTFANNTKPLLIKVVPNGQTNSVQNPANNKIHVHFIDQTTGKDAGGDYDIDLTKMQNGTNYYATPNGYAADNGGAFESKHFIKTYKVPTRTGVTLSDGACFYDSWQNYGSATPVDAINQIFKTLGASDATKLSVSLSYAPILYDDDGYTYTGVRIKNDTNGKTCIVSEDKRYASDWQRVAASALVQHLVDDDYGNATYLTGHVILTRTPLTYSSSFTDNYHPITNGTVTVPVHKSNSKSFIDNSGNAVSAKGNTVDVALTKKSDVDPSKVDPNSPGYKITHSSATRTIQINFPDQIPASYKNIVNDKGVLTQTVNFTRDATVDTLLDPSDPNYVLSEGPWKSDNQDPNFIGFPERTLPCIPGYTLRIAPLT